MKNDPTTDNLREQLWRREPTPAEEAALRAQCPDPEVQNDLKSDKQLTALLRRLPDAPVPTNFTARVLQTLELETRRQEREGALDFSWWLRIFIPRAAVAGVIVGVSTFSIARATYARRAEFGRSVAAVSEIKSLPSPQVLEDFDAISRLNETPRADTELLAAMDTR